MSLLIGLLVSAGILYCVLWWPRQFRRPSEKLKNDLVDAPIPTSTQTSSQVFADPLLLAGWVREHFLDGLPLSKDYELLPSAENRDGLEITAEQRDRCLCEYSVLRIAGVCLVVKRHESDIFWLRFVDQITKDLTSHINSVMSDSTYNSVRGAVEEYVHAADLDDGPRVATLYMTRVYDDNPNYIRMKVSGIGRIGHDTLIDSNDIMLDAYCKVKYGMSYEDLEAMSQEKREAQVH